MAGLARISDDGSRELVLPLRAESDHRATAAESRGSTPNGAFICASVHSCPRLMLLLHRALACRRGSRHRESYPAASNGIK